jgi:hypothetical protein
MQSCRGRMRFFSMCISISCLNGWGISASIVQWWPVDFSSGKPAE